MECSIKNLSKYRFESSVEALEDARIMYQAGRYKNALNRAYYSIFHSLRSVNVLDGFDSSKHSGVIAYFNQNYVKMGVFPKEISKFILSPSTRIEKFPSKSLIVPTLFPATATEAPIIGSPVSKSITEPTTVRVFACWAIATLFIFETSSAEYTTEEKETDKYTRLQHLMYHFAFEIIAFFMVQYLISR